jgi:hypothetical protein
MVELPMLPTTQSCYHAPEHTRSGLVLDQGSTLMSACDRGRFLDNDNRLLLDHGSALVSARNSILAFDSGGRVSLDTSTLILNDESGLVLDTNKRRVLNSDCTLTVKS